MKVYCDSGAFRKELAALQQEGKVTLVTFPYENTIKRTELGIPSAATFDDLDNFTWGSLPGTFESYQGSEKYSELQGTIGKENRRDILHLDSAFKTGCTVFLTTDQGDILRHRAILEPLLHMRLFNPAKEWDEFLAFLSEYNREKP